MTVLPADRPAALRAGLLLTGPAVVLATAAGVGVLPGELVALAAVGLLLAVAAASSPQTVLAVGLGLVAVVPFYSGRYLVGTLGITPMTALCLVLLPAALRAARRVRVQVLDLAVAALVVVRCLAYLLNYEGGTGAAASVVLGVALPYGVVRVVALAPDVPRRAALVLVTAAGALSLVGLQEKAGVPNPFFALAGQYQVAQWARPELRFGTVRAEASFGHPIAFGMFLALALVLAVALALQARSLPARLVLAADAGLIALALTATLSRGPLLVAVVGLLGWLLLVGRRVDAVRLLLLAAGVGAAVVATPALSTVQALVAQSSGDTRESRSAEYRLEVLAVALDPDQFGLLGRESRAAESVAGAVGARTGLKSVDSEYAVVYLSSGALALAALLVAAGAVAAIALRRGLDPLERAWAVALAASFLNLLTVALLTQHSELLWAAAALVAGTGQRARAAA